jgi:hypothetical protein
MPAATKTKKPTAAQLLAELPANFHFGIATPEQQDIVLHHIGELLGAEENAADTEETKKYFEGARCQRLDIHAERLKFLKLRDHYLYHETHSPHAAKALAQSQAAAEQAAAELAEAQGRYSAAIAARNAAEKIADEVEQASVAIATQCRVHKTAIETWLTRRN